ncbi:MAG: adenosine kinase [Treponema sp.]|nr:adenosine kinase [Treponema sp.]
MNINCSQPSSAPVELFCIGNAIVDVFAPADSAWLDRIGITEPAQHIERGLAQKILEELKSAKTATFSSGGVSANAAKIAAMLGMSAAFAGCVGSDDLAAIFENDLSSAGVIPYLATGKERTGLFFAFNCGSSSNEEDTGKSKIRVAASPGAAVELTQENFNAELISGAEMVVLDGFLLDQRPLVQQILQFADRRGMPIALDVGSVFQIQEKTADLLQYCRNYPMIIFMNADEAITFYQTIRKDNVSIDFSASGREKESFVLKNICPVLKCITEGDIFPVIVIKLGGSGAVILAGGNIHHEETYAVIPRNTVGAGDAFCAAFCSAWIRGKPVRKCAALGNKVARSILEVPGTRIEPGKLKSFAKLL